MKRGRFILKTDTLNNVVNLVNKVGSVKPQFHVVSSQDISKPLTGLEIGMTSTDLVYLYLEICDYYRVKFDMNDISSYEFLTINSIANLIDTHTK